jgi:hypothetical protein
VFDLNNRPGGPNLIVTGMTATAARLIVIRYGYRHCFIVHQVSQGCNRCNLS